MAELKIDGKLNDKIFKNVELSNIFALKDLVEYKESKVASLTLVQEKTLGITLMAIYKGEGLSTHSAPGEAFVTILDGEAEIFIEEERFELKSGESIIMPTNKPHSVKAITNMKMMLVLVK